MQLIRIRTPDAVHRRPLVTHRRALAWALVLPALLGATLAAPLPAPAVTGGTECLNWSRPRFPLLDVGLHDFGSIFGSNGTTDDVIDRDLEAGNVRLDWFIRTDGLIDSSLAAPPAAILDNDAASHWKAANGLRPGAEVRLYGGPLHAKSFRLNPDGSFEYRPTSGYFDADSFAYYYFLGNYCSQPTAVSIKTTSVAVVRADAYEVDAVPPPGATVLTPDQGVVIRPPLGTWITNQPFDLKDRCDYPSAGQYQPRCGVLLNDENIRDFVTIQWSPSRGRTAHGGITTRPDGSFAYTPDAGFEGQDAFTYTVTSPGPPSIRTATVTLNVRRRPVATVYATADVLPAAQDVPLPIAPALLMSNDFGATEIRTVSGDTNFAGADPTFGRPSSRRTAHGTLAIGWAHLDPILGPFWVGSLAYTPDALYFGPDAFYYEVRGSGATAWASVSIDVANKPDSPRARTDVVTVLPGSVTPIDVLANDSDPDGDLLTLAFTPDSSGLWTQAGATIVFTAPPAFYGTPFTTYRVYDTTGLSSDAVVVARVSPLFPDDYAMDEDTMLSVGSPGVRSNDTACNLCEPSVSVELVDQPSHGSVVLAGSGAFTYTPAENFSGTDTFTYRARGGNDAYVFELLGGEKTVVTITVRNAPEAPTVVLNDACQQSVPSDPCADDLDARVVQEGAAVRLRGYVTDPDPGFSGNLFIDWGDGTPTQITPYPCLAGQVGGVECDTAWITPTWSGATPSSDRMYFDLSHVYRNGPPGTPDTYRISVGAGDETGLANPTGAVALATVFDGPPTPTAAQSPTPTVTATPTTQTSCIGDCDGGGSVTVDEIITLVSIALGGSEVSSCPHGARGGEGFDVALIITAVNNALGMCRHSGAAHAAR